MSPPEPRTEGWHFSTPATGVDWTFTPAAPGIYGYFRTLPHRQEWAEEERAAVVRLDHQRLLFWLLRLACFCEFVGHGTLGIITKAAWVPYFGVVGIPERWAYTLMPPVRSVDITLGFLVLLKPIRAALLYMALWGLWTALLRPLSGEPVWETIERAAGWFSLRPGRDAREA